MRNVPMTFKINFELKELDQVLLWGEAPNQRIHWFGLTDGLLWIDVGEQTIYEYSKEAQEYFEECHPYNDYQLSRFLEDFSELFKGIGESVPRELYDYVEEFEKQAEQWQNLYIDLSDELFNQFYFEDYLGMTSWLLSERTMDSGHLVGGPHISFVRCEDKIKIFWTGNYQLENGRNMWKFPSGVFEMSYNEFVDEVTRFFQAFYSAMDRQVENAVKKEWGCVTLDKDRLVIENVERKERFNQLLLFLSQPPAHTDWDKVLLLHKRMIKEIQTGLRK